MAATILLQSRCQRLLGLQKGEVAALTRSDRTRSEETEECHENLPRLPGDLACTREVPEPEVALLLVVALVAIVAIRRMRTLGVRP
jgi:hypothetical protein